MKSPLTSLFFALALSILPGSAAAAPAAHPEIPLITGGEPEQGYNARMLAVQRLPRDLLPADQARLTEFLHTRAEDDPLRRDYLNAVKNDVVVRLLKQSRPPAGLAGHLIEAFHNEDMDVVWRDYCLQHLSSCHQLADDEQTREKILEVLLEATRMRESTFAGTSLLSLREIGRDSPESVDEQDLANRALAVAQDPDRPTPSRISAIQVAGAHPEIAAFARETARDVSADMMLRMSAVAVLGQSADPKDLPLIEELSHSSDVRLRASARAALRKFDSGSSGEPRY